MRSLGICTFLVLSIMMASTITLRGIDPAKPSNHYQLNIFTSENGLPMNSVISLAQTPDGFIWIGTETGLVRFDGITFELYNRKNLPLMTNELIRTLLVDRSGTLWIGIRGGGVLRFRNGRFESFDTENLISDIIWTMAESRDGSIWIGASNGCIRYHDGHIEKITFPPESLSENIRAITEDYDGNIWLGTPKGLISVKRKGDKLHSEFKGYKNTQINAILQDRSGVLWLGTMGRGLIRFHQGKKRFYGKSSGFKSNEIQCIIEDHPGNLWVGTYGGGVYVKKPDSRTFLRFDQTINIGSSSVYALLEDRERTLWIGTESGGLSNLREARVISYSKKDGLSQNIIHTLFEDSRGGIWIGTMGSGIDCFRNNRFRNISQSDGLAANTIVSFAEHPEGWLWIGIRGGGINRFNLTDNTIDLFNTRNGLSGSIVRSLYTDPEGILWAGTDDGGLHRFIGERFHLTQKIPYRINTMFKDTQNYLWIGTWGNGIYRYKPDRLEIFNKEKGMGSNVVFAFHQDENECIWIGTYGSGLIRYKDGVFRGIAKNDGLCDDTVFSIIEDQKKNLWMSTNNGITSINRLELEKYLQNSDYKFHPTVFSKEDGMKSTECNGGGQPAGIMTRKGQIWFPTTRGISMIDPGQISMNPIPPPVVIKKFIVNRNSLPIHSDNPIYEWEKGIQIGYTALSFIVPRRIRFKYRLKGFDTKWVDAGSRRLAHYPDLPPGRYKFSVIAANSDGTWNREGDSFEFVLKSKFYQTILFKTLLLFILLLISYGLFYLGRKIDHIRKMRKKFHLSFMDKSRKDEYIRKIFYFIEMKKVYRDPDLSLNSFARSIDINPRYLSQLINDELEKGFLDLINSYRIEEAKRLLSDPARHDMSVLDICMEAGFNSKSSFNRAFKRYTGQTPSEFKKKYQH